MPHSSKPHHANSTVESAATLAAPGLLDLNLATVEATRKELEIAQAAIRGHLVSLQRLQEKTIHLAYEQLQEMPPVVRLALKALEDALERAGALLNERLFCL